MATMDIIGYINTQEPVLSWIPAKKQAMLDDYIKYYNYQEEIWDETTGTMIPNPQTKKDFANDMLEKEIKDKIKSVRKSAAEAAAAYEEIDFIV